MTNPTSIKFWDHPDPQVRRGRVSSPVPPEAAIKNAVKDAQDVCARAGLVPCELLELGCGYGRLSMEFDRLGFRVLGCDISPGMIADARQAVPSGAFRLIEDGTIPFADDSADASLAYLILQHVATKSEVYRYMREMVRVTRPGGKIAMQTYRATQPADFDGFRGAWFASLDEFRLAAEIAGVNVLDAHEQVINFANVWLWVIGTPGDK